MGGHGAGMAGLDHPRPGWDRFAHWRRGPAIVLLIVLAVLLALAALTPLTASMDGEVASVPALVAEDAAPKGEGRDSDLALYDRIIARVAKGENYYSVAVEEQRRGDYPVRPGLAVRLPTLAFLHAWLGEDILQGLSILLLGATAYAWWKRLGDEPGGARYRLISATLMVLGGSSTINRYYFVLHEFWTGMLIALAFALHRPGRWHASLSVAAAALLLREHALPFVLLMAAMALWRRDWREGAAWALLTLIYAALLMVHLSTVAAYVGPQDPLGPTWLTLDGLSGWLSKIVLASNLRFLPHFIAGPLVLLMVFGWAGWKSDAGRTACLLYLGYALAFMIAGRANNFYWGAVVAPAMFVGLAFVPMATRSLARTALGRA